MAIRKLNKRKAHQVYKTVDGLRLPGCSTVVKYGPPTEAFVKWAHRLGMEGIDYSKERDYSSDIGSIAHFLIEVHFSGDQPDLSAFGQDAIDEAKNAFNNFMIWWDNQKYMVITTEAQLTSQIHGYGGTLDMLCLDEQNRRTLLDFKVTKGIYHNHLLQVAGYENLNNENYPNEPIERRGIVQISKEPGDIKEPRWFGPKDISDAFEIFKGQVLLYNLFKQYGW